MQFHQLRYFVSTVKYGSMSQAAKHCYVSQPSLSQQIKQLEQTVGHKLFIRDRGKLTLTETGETLYQEAINILASVNIAEEKIRNQNQSKSNRLSLGILPTVSTFILNDILTALSLHQPDLQLNIRESHSENIVEACLNGELDLVITSSPVEHEYLTIEPLIKDVFCVVLQDHHPLAGADEIEIKVLYDEPFILIENIHCLHSQTAALCRKAGFEAKARFEVGSIATIQELVAAGYGISILPDLSKRLYRPGIKYIPIVGEPYRQLLTVHRHDFKPTESQQHFMDVVDSIYRTS